MDDIFKCVEACASGQGTQYGHQYVIDKEVTILLKAPPIMTPTAMSMMFPLRINALNSFITLLMLLIGKASIICDDLSLHEMSVIFK